MAKDFSSVSVTRMFQHEDLEPISDHSVSVVTDYGPQGLIIKLKRETNEDKVEGFYEFTVNAKTECVRAGEISYLFNLDNESLCLKFKEKSDLKSFHSLIIKAKVGKSNSFPTDRTNDNCTPEYFQSYGYLSEQQYRLQDYVCTRTYQHAILANSNDFMDKVVLDAGAGCGILSFFAVQAGAKQVYAVEASSMAKHAQTLVASNNMKDKICVIAGKIEEVELPEMVDIIISEPMGYMLYSERLLEKYLHAKKWLKPGGLMFPSKGDLHIAPFTDDLLFMERTNEANFWLQTSFHGVDVSSVREAAMKEYMQQPILDTFDIRICLAKSCKHSMNFTLAQESDLQRIEIPLQFRMLNSGIVHGLAFWFDVAFAGSSQTVWLSTAPTEPLTHWYQVRCFLKTPIFISAGQCLTGTLLLQANHRQSYDITIDLCLESNKQTRSVNTVDLKNIHFRYTGLPVNTPPGMNTQSPSEVLWADMDAGGTFQGVK